VFLKEDKDEKSTTSAGMASSCLVLALANIGFYSLLVQMMLVSCAPVERVQCSHHLSTSEVNWMSLASKACNRIFGLSLQVVADKDLMEET
jgi:hypothetical protein